MNKPPFIEFPFRSIAQFDKQAAFFDAHSRSLVSYWTDGQEIYWRDHEVSAHAASFQVFNKTFAKDQHHCFMQNKRLAQADTESFTALNPCYAKDRKFAWTVGGRFEPADIASFEVCDGGLNKRRDQTVYSFSDASEQSATRCIPGGYAKDNRQVYVYDFWGKTKIVAKADPSNFVSNMDSVYGRDDFHVFYLQKVIKDADPQSWRVIDLDEGFSRDDTSLFRLDKRWANADIQSFALETMALNGEAPQKYPRDKSSYFSTLGERISLQQLMDEEAGAF